MAIELHHLNTHGMMEQAGNVLDGVVRLKERIAELEKLNHDLCERVTENDEIRLHWEEIEQTRAENERMKARITELEKENAELKEQYRDMDVTHTVHIAKMNALIEELEESQRWRKCSEEMPSADEGYFIALWEDKFPDIGYIGAEDDVIETIRDRGEDISCIFPTPSSCKSGILIFSKINLSAFRKLIQKCCSIFIF